MRAIILAAGRGVRLQQSPEIPKCLLRFAGMTLLERHLRMLRNAGVDEIVLALGFLHDQVAAELDKLAWQPRPQIIINERYELGSVLTVHIVRQEMIRGGDVLLMDADVLYDERIMRALVADTRPVNRILIDRDFEAGDEPVKVCVRAGVPIELRKRLADGLAYDTIGESIGFFRLAEPGARRLAQLVNEYIEDGRADMPHEEAIRDVIRERSQVFEVTDVTGAPWVEIDFPADIDRATLEVLPQLEPIAGVRS